MSRGFPGKQPGNHAAVAALKELLMQARTLDLFTPESLAKSCALPVEQVKRMLSDAKVARVMGR